MFEAIKRLFENTENAIAVKNAVKKGWITGEQYKEITGLTYEA